MFGSALILTLASIGSPLPPLTLSLSSNSEASVPFVAEVPDKSAFAEHPLSIEGWLGIAMPTGGLGVAVEYSFIDELALGCGVGSNVLGWEPACWLRGRLLLTPDRALTLASGLSTSHFSQGDSTRDGVFDLFIGPLSEMGESTTNERDYAHARWWNTDVGYESRKGRLVFREFLGVAALLNPSEGVPVVYPSNNKPAESPISAMAYAGIGLGIAP